MQQRAAAAAVAAPAVPLPVQRLSLFPCAAYSGLSATGSSRDSGCSARTDDEMRWHGNKSAPLNDAGKLKIEIMPSGRPGKKNYSRIAGWIA